MDSLLSVRNLEVEFRGPEGATRAVDGVSFGVPPAGVVALVGESGSGKSVTAQAIMGLLPRNGHITGGQILFRDPERGDEAQDIAALDQNGHAMRQLRGGRISMIFQEPMTSLSPVHTIGNQIVEALRLHRKVARGERLALAADMLRLVGFPDPGQAVDSYPFELSGGLRQRALIAMALVCRPALLIADEPTTALDVTVQLQILKLVKDLQAKLKMAVLLITHDLGVVANIADAVVVMCQGRVVERGLTADIYKRPGHAYLQSLLAAVPRLGGPPAKAAPRKSDILLEVNGISKSFTPRYSGLFAKAEEHRVRVLDNVSFSIGRGECLGLVGESGSGKTTVSKIIMGALRPDSGTVTIATADGIQDVHGQTTQEWKAYRRRVQYVFQDPVSSLNPRMTAFEIIAEPLVIHGIGNRKVHISRVQELMALVGLDPRFMRRYPHSFSGGQRQRIGLARAMALEPELLICDEPVSALDVSIQAQILDLIKDLQREMGLTYLFISHDLAVINLVADRIAVMCAGRLVECAERGALFGNAIHPYTRALLAAVPEPDPDRPLDLSAEPPNHAPGDPAHWPPPFAASRDREPELVDIGGGHLVRALAAPGAGPVTADPVS